MNPRAFVKDIEACANSRWLDSHRLKADGLTASTHPCGCQVAIMDGPPRICVIIPVYGNWDDAVHCLQALESQTTGQFRILIADDGSPTAPPDAILKSERASYFRGANAGFGANCHRAAQREIAQGATHLLFLNSDTSFGPAFMEHWIARAAEIPEAILSPLIYWARNSKLVWSSGGKFTVFTPYMRSRERFDRLAEVDVVTGCAILVPAEVWTTLGGFDPKYVMYFEDFDLTLRAKAAGIRTFVVPDLELRVQHHVSGSFRGAGVWKKHYLMLTSTLIFIRSHYRGVRKAICLGLGIAHFGVTAVLCLPELPKPRPLWSALLRGLSQ